MPKRPSTFRPQYVRSHPERRPSPTARGYTAAWAKASKGFLRANPLCVMCLDRNLVTSATVTDHVKPHKGDMELFWDPDNWQALCKRCHDRKTATEDGGFGRVVSGSHPAAHSATPPEPR